MTDYAVTVTGHAQAPIELDDEVWAVTIQFDGRWGVINGDVISVPEMLVRCFRSRAEASAWINSATCTRKGALREKWQRWHPFLNR